jgi:hypothetical protein
MILDRDDPAYFSQAYRNRLRAPSWGMLRGICFALTFGRDALCPLLRARQLDHLTYERLGREIPLFDVLPLSGGTHRLITALRDRFGRERITMILRAIGLVWMTLDVALFLGITGFFRIR